jgi:hypothetical protein
MFNPWAITFQAARLGFEAQNAAALQLMRLVGGTSKTQVRGMVADKIGAPPDVPAAPRQSLHQTGPEGVSPSIRSTKSDRARTSASALSKRYSLKNSAPRTT